VCLEISRALKGNQRLHVRMGIHTGRSVCGGRERTDERGRRGHQPGPTSDGLWRRRAYSSVPSCGRGPGGIRTMRPFLHDIGTFEVKHGVRVSVDQSLPPMRLVIRSCRANCKRLRNITPMCVGRRLRPRCWCRRIIGAGLFFLRRPGPVSVSRR